VANTAWAFATLGVSAPALFKKIDEKCAEIKLVENGKTQEISNTAWSFASLQHPARNLFQKINEHAGDGRTKGIVSKMKTQDISNTSWAMATLQYDGSKLFEAVDARSEFLVERGNTQCLANTAFAFALIGYKPTNLLDAMEKKVSRAVPIPRGALRALHRAPRPPAPLFTAPPAPLPRSSPRPLLTPLLHSLRSPARFAPPSQVKLFAENANPQEICNALWSITMLGMAREKEFMLKTIWERAVRTDPKLFNNASMGQLYQVTVHARVDGIMLQPVSSVLRNNMSAAMKSLVDIPSKVRGEQSERKKELELPTADARTPPTNPLTLLLRSLRSLAVPNGVLHVPAGHRLPAPVRGRRAAPGGGRRGLPVHRHGGHGAQDRDRVRRLPPLPHRAEGRRQDEPRPRERPVAGQAPAAGEDGLEGDLDPVPREHRDEPPGCAGAQGCEGERCERAKQAHRP
jgi:hypothetical protein